MAIHESGQMYLETIYILFTEQHLRSSYRCGERSWALPSPASAEPCPF